MIDIVQQTIRYFITNGKAPELHEITVEDETLKEKPGSVFITLYHNGEVRGSAWNIKPIEENLLKEIIQSTVSALANDDRFDPVTLEESENIKIRIDLVTSEVILVNEKELTNLEPKKIGTIAIKKDYDKMAVILPNISSTLLFWKDFPEALGKKLWETFKFSDYIVYKMETQETTNF